MRARRGVAVGDDVARATAVGDKDDEAVGVGRVARDGARRTNATPTTPARRTTSGASMAHLGKRRKGGNRDALGTPDTGAAASFRLASDRAISTITASARREVSCSDVTCTLSG
jgi:hypothetical protein